MKLKTVLLGRKAMTNLDSVLKSGDITLLTKVHIVKAMVFPHSMWMWALDHKEDWVLENWCFRIVVLEKTLESPLDCKEIQPVNPQGNQPWIFIGRTGAEADAPILWPPVKSWLTGKDPDTGKDWGQEEKGVTEDEMITHNDPMFSRKQLSAFYLKVEAVVASNSVQGQRTHWLGP